MKYLFVSNFFLPANANTIIFDQYIKQNNKMDSYVLYSIPFNVNVNVTEHKKEFIRSLFYYYGKNKFLSILFRVIRYFLRFISFFPFSFQLFFSKYFRIIKLLKKNKINQVVLISEPHENMLIAIILKIFFKKSLNISFLQLDYFYDSLSIFKHSLFYPIKKLIAYTIELVAYKEIDKVYLFPHIYNIKIKNKFLNNKIIKLNYGLLTNCKNSIIHIKNVKRIKFVYGGSLDKLVRNPNLTFRFLDFMYPKIPLIAYFYTNFLHLPSKDYLIHKPIVSYQEFFKISSNGTFNLVIGNESLSLEIPSKLFSLISLNKPIIYILNNPNDPVQDLFKDYQGIMFVNEHNFNEALEWIKGKKFFLNRSILDQFSVKKLIL